jgi:hypothetical protein
LMKVLRPVVAPSTTLMSFCNSKVIDCGSARFEIVRDELVRYKTVFLQKLAHEFQRRALVPPALDENSSWEQMRNVSVRIALPVVEAHQTNSVSVHYVEIDPEPTSQQLKEVLNPGRRASRQRISCRAAILLGGNLFT